MKLLHMSRRTFISHSIAGLVTALTACRPQTVQGHEFSGHKRSKGVLFDMTRCIGCRSCEAACNKEQGLPEPDLPFNDTSVFESSSDGQKRRPDEKSYTVVNKYDSSFSSYPIFRKIQCFHCLEPACLTACFVNAYKKTTEGAVIYNPDVCVGCRTCMVACPFSIPAFRYSSAFEPRIMKCVFCYDTRLKNDLPPACVEACPREALTFGTRTSLLRIARQRIRENPDRYINYIYGEQEAGGTAWLTISGVPFTEAGFDTSVPKQPIINYVKDFLAIVPMVLTIWPGLFAGFHLLAKKKTVNQIKKDEAQERRL